VYINLVGLGIQKLTLAIPTYPVAEGPTTAGLESTRKAGLLITPVAESPETE